MSYLSTYDLHNIFLADCKAIRRRKKKLEQSSKSTDKISIHNSDKDERGAKHDRISYE